MTKHELDISEWYVEVIEIILLIGFNYTLQHKMVFDIFNIKNLLIESNYVFRDFEMRRLRFWG